MAFRVWQRALNVTDPAIGFLCCEPGSADAGFVWNFTDGDFVDPSTDPDIADCSQAMTLLDDWEPLANSLYYYDVTTLGGSPGRIIPLIFSANTLIGQGEELYIRGNERVSQTQNDLVLSGVTVLQWQRALLAVLCGAVDPSTSGGLTTNAFKWPNLEGSTYATVVCDDAEDGKRNSGAVAS